VRTAAIPDSPIFDFERRRAEALRLHDRGTKRRCRSRFDTVERRRKRVAHTAVAPTTLRENGGRAALRPGAPMLPISAFAITPGATCESIRITSAPDAIIRTKPPMNHDTDRLDISIAQDRVGADLPNYQARAFAAAASAARRLDSTALTERLISSSATTCAMRLEALRRCSGDKITFRTPAESARPRRSVSRGSGTASSKRTDNRRCFASRFSRPVF